MPYGLLDQLQTGVGDGASGGGGGEESDEFAGGGGVFGAGGDSSREDGDPLRAGWKRSNDLDSFDGAQFADLLEADLGVTARDDIANRFGGDSLAFGFDPIGDAETWEQVRGEIRAARGGGIGD